MHMKFLTLLKKSFNKNGFFALAAIAALLVGILEIPFFMIVAETVSQIFINLLKLVSLPIIFLSMVSTASGMENLNEIKILGKKVFKYTLLTTLIAATIALLIFVLLEPAQMQLGINKNLSPSSPQQFSYLHYLVQIIPSNILQPFIENNVIAVLLLAMLFSLAVISLPNENRSILHTFFSSLYAAIMKMTTWIIKLMPIAMWAFMTLFLRDLRLGLEVKSLALYLLCVLISNLLQACCVLPLLLKSKGIPVFQTFRGMLPALSVAFFTKSSSAALPMAMACAEERVGISRKIASFSLPLCTTINMNACAAFILTTVLFVSMSNGMTYSPAELITWIFLATIAAVGNAGVPMGCYFLASAFLATMNVPLNILGVILPFYSIIDMLESAINVWSDSCVTAIVHTEVMGHPSRAIPVDNPQMQIS